MVTGVFVAACNSGGAATETGATPGVTASVAASATAAARPDTTSTAGATVTAPAAATPTAVSAPSSSPTPPPPSTGPVDLEAVVPTEVGAITMTPEVIAADDFLGAYEDFGPMLGALGKSPADVTIVQAQGSDPQGSEIMIVQAFRVAGADPAALMSGFLDFWKVTDDEAVPITIADKQLIVQGHPDTDAQFKSYYYSYGDVVFRLGYNGDNFDEQMAALVSQLP